MGSGKGFHMDGDDVWFALFGQWFDPLRLYSVSKIKIYALFNDQVVGYHQGFALFRNRI